MSDDAINAAQIRAARGLLALSSAELAKQAGVSEASLVEIESGAGEAGLHAKIVTTLEAAGVAFLAEDDGQGVGVRLARPQSFPREIPVADLNASNDE